jgi:hypothetical protein
MLLIKTLALKADRIVSVRDPEMAAGHERGMEIRRQRAVFQAHAVFFAQHARRFVAHFVRSRSIVQGSTVQGVFGFLYLGANPHPDSLPSFFRRFGFEIGLIVNEFNFGGERVCDVQMMFYPFSRQVDIDLRHVDIARFANRTNRADLAGRFIDQHICDKPFFWHGIHRRGEFFQKCLPAFAIDRSLNRATPKFNILAIVRISATTHGLAFLRKPGFRLSPE